MTKNLTIYQAENGAIELKADSTAETIWASQKQIAQVFSVNSQAITKHIKNIYNDGELLENPTCSKMEQVEDENGRTVVRQVKHYNLDMIISIGYGYRINSKKATQFRQWATKTLKQHIAQGYTVNDNSGKEVYELDENGDRKLDEHNHLIQKHDLKEISEAFEVWAKDQQLSF